MGERRLLDNLHPGAPVIAADNRHVGRLHAVVVDPRDNEVTHIVVNAGPHFPEPGFGAPRLVDVPVAEMADASEERVLLKCTRDAFARLPEYAERSFTIPPAAAEPSREIAVPLETFRRASFERHIMNGAPVWRTDPHAHMGNVDRVLVNEENDEIEALVIRRGVLFPEDVILPVEYVTEILDGVVHVRISDQDLLRLERFHETEGG